MKRAFLILGICVACMLIGATEANQEVLEVYIKYDSGNVTIQGVFTDTGRLPQYPEITGPYTVRMTSKDNKTIYARNFDIETDIMDSDRSLQVAKEALTIPYNNSAQALSVYHNGVKLDSKQLASTNDKQSGKTGVTRIIEDNFLYILSSSLILLIILVFAGVKHSLHVSKENREAIPSLQ